ncbi:MAG: hypothetical protein ACTS9Y_13480 [Methylophilus sp.]|uniref:hypothetical protein n=1 Tax=Methylophilus sp. TaxID=29541 RepID=UPI003FA04FAD
MGNKNEIYRGPLILLAVLVICILVVVFSNQNQSESSHLIPARYIPWSPENKCLNLHKADFNDPDSAYVHSSYTLGKSDLNITENPISRHYIEEGYGMLVVNVRAKNAYGAYVKAYVACPTDSDGVSELLTAAYRVQQDQGLGLGVSAETPLVE